MKSNPESRVRRAPGHHPRASPVRRIGAASFLLNLVAGALLGVGGCTEVFETDISPQTAVPIAPADQLASRNVTQTFRWQALEGARTYRLQVGSPSLADPSAFFADTLTKKTSLRLVLQSGRFEWRLSARNAGYESGAVVRSLRIDSSANLAEQNFRLLTPANNATPAANVVQFSWEALPMATRYLLQVGGFATDTVVASQFVKTLPTDARSYSWTVTALNATSRKLADQAFVFSIATGSPAVPTLLTPANNAAGLTLPLTLTWQRSDPTAVRDSLYLYLSSQTLLAGFPRAVTATAYRLDRASVDLGTGTYYWSVKSVGANGQTGRMSERRAFALQF